MSGALAVANPRRIKAAHRRRRKVASGPIVQRYYDPVIGRFLSVDAVTADGNTGGNFNRYWYANNNPYKFTDPDGRFADTILDVAFIVADIVDIASNGLNATNGASLGGNLLGAAIPGATGLGKVAVAGVAIIKGADRGADAGKAARAGHNGVEGPAKVEARTTRAGEPASKITFPDGSVKDVSPSRVKESVPQTHPNAPAGTMQKVKFDDAQPGSKGFKRDPTPDDLKDAGIKK